MGGLGQEGARPATAEETEAPGGGMSWPRSQLAQVGPATAGTGTLRPLWAQHTGRLGSQNPSAAAASSRPSPGAQAQPGSLQGQPSGVSLLPSSQAQILTRLTGAASGAGAETRCPLPAPALPAKFPGVRAAGCGGQARNLGRSWTGPALSFRSDKWTKERMRRGLAMTF